MPYHTIFTNEVPAITDVNVNDGPITLGTHWYTEAEGAVHAVRFYLGNRNYDGYQVVGGLFMPGQATPLAQKTFTVTAANPIGYVEIVLDEPVIVARNQSYIAAVWFPRGAGNNVHYSVTGSFFANHSVDNPPLHAYQDDTVFNQKLNGLFMPGDSLALPTNSFSSNGYFIDVTFDYFSKAKVRSGGAWTEHPVKTRVAGNWKL